MRIYFNFKWTFSEACEPVANSIKANADDNGQSWLRVRPVMYIPQISIDILSFV